MTIWPEEVLNLPLLAYRGTPEDKEQAWYKAEDVNDMLTGVLRRAHDAEERADTAEAQVMALERLVAAKTLCQITLDDLIHAFLLPTLCEACTKKQQP